MAEIKTYRCDECGKQKGISNHWWKARIIEAFHLYRWDFHLGEDGIDVVHLCSDGCVTKAASKWMHKIQKPPASASGS